MVRTTMRLASVLMVSQTWRDASAGEHVTVEEIEQAYRVHNDGRSIPTGTWDQLREACEISITESMKTPNHALQRTRPSRPGCNPRVPRAGSLSLGR